MKVFVFMVSLSTVFGAPLLAQEASPARPRQELYHELVQRHLSAEAQLSQSDTDLARVGALLLRFETADLSLLAQLQTATTERDQLRLSVEKLERLLAQLRELLKLDPDSVQKALEQALAAREKLLIDEAKLREESNEPEPDLLISTAISLEGMESRAFLLTGERIAPFSTPYFTQQRIKVRLRDRRVVERPRYTRANDAGLVVTSVLPGGPLHELVSSPDFDRDRTYVTLWVCADAIDAYHVAVNYLKFQGVRYNLVPDVDQPWTALDDESPLGNWGYEG